uniref:Reverse transcriptase Ty1/copia-type domain-containing protein n=1 Tax=Fagus sylvatica TaxID=28930 RepID=A0A2N9HQU3_FAGSY
MTLIFTDPSIDLYPDNVRDSASPSSSLEVSSLVLSPAAGLPDSDPTPSVPLESPTDIRHSTLLVVNGSIRSRLGTDGSVERYKARLVARVFTQEYGIDYEETFAPVALLTSVRSLLAVAAPPPGYPDSQNQVCRLRRALYGLKQAPRAWFAKISNVVMTLQAYVIYRSFLSQHFEMKDLDTLSYFLGLEVTSSSDGYYFSQAMYASDFLSKAGLTDSKTDSTPLELNVKLNTIDSEPLFDATLYQQLVGSLIYLTVTRPYLAYAVHLVSQFMSAPRSTHYAAVLRILQYIKGTLFHGLHFSAHSSLELCAYADVDWVGDPTDRRSTTVLKLSIVLSPMPPQNSSGFVGSWLTWVLPKPPVLPIHCDNRSAIHIAHNDVFHERTKHIEIDYHFIRHHLQQSALHLLSVSSKDQLADVFTKSNPPGRLRDLVSKLKMASLSPPCV